MYVTVKENSKSYEILAGLQKTMEELNFNFYRRAYSSADHWSHQNGLNIEYEGGNGDAYYLIMDFHGYDKRRYKFSYNKKAPSPAIIKRRLKNLVDTAVHCLQNFERFTDQ